MLLDGGLTVWVVQPTYGGLEACRKFFYVYTLKSILVHSETKKKTLIGIIAGHMTSDQSHASKTVL